MEWIKELIKKIFRKKQIKLIEAPKLVDNKENARNNFIVMLKQTADLERNDGNGYKIAPNLKLKDMV